MRYMLLIFGDEATGSTAGTPEHTAMLEKYFAFSRKIREAGVEETGDELGSSDTATVVRVRDGETRLTDGPFIESKEQLGGFYILNVENLDEAIRWASEIPGASTGGVEIRPIIEH